MLTFQVGIVLLGILSVGALGGIGWFLYMKLRYKTVPSNKALIITGTNLGDPKKEPNIFQDEQGRYMKVIRGGGHRLRMFQTHTPVSLTSFQLRITTPKVYTKQGVGIFGEAVATIKVADDLQGIVKYAEQFLGKKQKEIESDISEVLGSNLRAILSQMTVEQINSDRENFNEKVRKIAQEQLDEMGFKITSLGLTNITDDEGYLENLGRPQVSSVKKQAEIAESTNNRETKVHVAQMTEEVKKEEYDREMSIANSRKQKEINDSKIKAETEKERAMAEASYELEQEDRRLDIEKKRLEIAEQNKRVELELLMLERKNQVTIEEQEVSVRKHKADALHYEKIKQAEADAESHIAQGNSEAQVIAMKSKAEIEAIEKRAEALNNHKEVMLTEMVIKMMPEFAKAVAEPMSNVESIRILDGGSGGQVGSLSKTVTNTMTNLQESLGQMTGIDLDSIINSIASVDDDEVNDLVDVTDNKNNESVSEEVDE